MNILISAFFPLWNFLARISNIRGKEAKWAFYMLCLWIGALFIYNMEGGTLVSDSSRVAMQFTESSNYSGDFLTFFKNRSLHDSNDFFQVTSMYFVSRLGGNPRIWFFYIAAIFGFFYTSNMWYIISKCGNKFQPLTVVLLALIFLAVPITEGLNATRMNLAIQVYLYGLLPYFMEGDFKKLWVSLLSLLIHFSMFLPVVVFIAYYFIPKKNIIPYYYIFFLSFFVNSLDLSAVASYIEMLPLGLDSRTGLYLEDSSLEQEMAWRENSSLLYKLSFNALQYICTILTAFIFFKKDEFWEKNENMKKWLIFALLFYSLANILAILPSGYRFLRITNILLLSLYLIYFNYNRLTIPMGYKVVLYPIAIYSIIFSIRCTFDYYGLQMFYGNFMTSLFFEDNVPITKILGLSI